MKTTKQFISLVLIGIMVLILSCSKDKDAIEPEKPISEWQFARAVNIHATKSASGLDFYQYKGDKVRILQFEFDDLPLDFNKQFRVSFTSSNNIAGFDFKK